jgi:hypothetical protein
MYIGLNFIVYICFNRLPLLIITFYIRLGRLDFMVLSSLELQIGIAKLVICQYIIFFQWFIMHGKILGACDLHNSQLNRKSVRRDLAFALMHGTNMRGIKMKFECQMVYNSLK